MFLLNFECPLMLELFGNFGQLFVFSVQKAKLGQH